MKYGFKNWSFEIFKGGLFLYLVKVKNEGVKYRGVVFLHMR